MKNIAIPLLVAGSANAQLDDMAADRAVAAPTLIAETWWQDGCENQAVTDARTALTNQNTIVEAKTAALTKNSDGLAAEATPDNLTALFKAAGVARGAAATALSELQATHAQLFVDDDAARKAVAEARLAFQEAQVIRLAAEAVDSAAAQAKADAIASIALADVGELAVKTAMQAAYDQAVAHVVHERAELAQLECLGNRDQTDEVADGRTYRECGGGGTCSAYAADELDCTTTDRASATRTNGLGALSGLANCSFTDGNQDDFTRAYTEPTYASTARAINCSAPEVPGIARTSTEDAQDLTTIVAKPALGVTAHAAGLQAVAIAKAAVLTTAGIAAEASSANVANTSGAPDARKLTADLTLAEKSAEMTELAFESARLASNAAARYREVAHINALFKTYETARGGTTGNDLDETTADTIAKLADTAYGSYSLNPGLTGKSNTDTAQDTVQNISVKAITISAFSDQSDQNGIDSSALGAWVNLARKLSGATKKWWTAHGAENWTEETTARNEPEHSGNTCAGGSGSQCTSQADTSQGNCESTLDDANNNCTWSNNGSYDVSGPCDTASDSAKIDAITSGAADMATCKSTCSDKTLYGATLSTDPATLNLPTAFSLSGTTTTTCVGYSWNNSGTANTDQCYHYKGGFPTGGITGSARSADSKCEYRDKASDSQSYMTHYANAITALQNGASGAAFEGQAAVPNETVEAFALKIVTEQARRAKVAQTAANNLLYATEIAEGQMGTSARVVASSNTCTGGDDCTAIVGAALFTETACIAAKKTNGTDACDYATVQGAGNVPAIAAPWSLSYGDSVKGGVGEAWKGASWYASLATGELTDAEIIAIQPTEPSWVTGTNNAVVATVAPKKAYTDAVEAKDQADAALKANTDAITSTWIEIRAQETIRGYALASKTRADTAWTNANAIAIGTPAVTAVAASDVALNGLIADAQQATLALTGSVANYPTITEDPIALVTAPLRLINDARAAFDEAVLALGTAKGNLDDAEGERVAAVLEQTILAGLQADAIQACERAMFRSYKEDLATAISNRASVLADIKQKLADAAPPARGSGVAGARCEKALSNGTFRPVRQSGAADDIVINSGGCGKDLCCGAAVVPQAADATGGGAWQTIETCQAVDTKTYSYQPARAAALETALPAPVSVTWTCIEGAQKLAAAASALAAAVYVLA